VVAPARDSQSERSVRPPDESDLRIAREVARRSLPPTPLVRSDKLHPSAWIKVESAQPTGSFKPRGAAVAIEYVLELGVREVQEYNAVLAKALAEGLDDRDASPRDRNVQAGTVAVRFSGLDDERVATELRSPD
jgi:Pyridoxal-phosphate dependent enzyme